MPDFEAPAFVVFLPAMRNPVVTVPLAYPVSFHPNVVAVIPAPVAGRPDYPGWQLAIPGIAQGVPLHNIPTPKKDLAPRLGLAYRAANDFVIRANYGIFYDTPRVHCALRLNVPPRARPIFGVAIPARKKGRRLTARSEFVRQNAAIGRHGSGFALPVQWHRDPRRP